MSCTFWFGFYLSILDPPFVHLGRFPWQTVEVLLSSLKIVGDNKEEKPQCWRLFHTEVINEETGSSCCLWPDRPPTTETDHGNWSLNWTEGLVIYTIITLWRPECLRPFHYPVCISYHWFELQSGYFSYCVMLGENVRGPFPHYWSAPRIGPGTPPFCNRHHHHGPTKYLLTWLTPSCRYL